MSIILPYPENPFLLFPTPHPGIDLRGCRGAVAHKISRNMEWYGIFARDHGYPEPVSQPFCRCLRPADIGPAHYPLDHSPCGCPAHHPKRQLHFFWRSFFSEVKHQIDIFNDPFRHWYGSVLWFFDIAPVVKFPFFQGTENNSLVTDRNLLWRQLKTETLSAYPSH